MNIFRYFHYIGDGWKGKATWYSCLATDLQMAMDLIETHHKLKDSRDGGKKQVRV